ncbi:uncharacterized protein [Diadema setosum]|uniref:uncharacterized protein n=1 Tax=Diadema setosum TaxID=31175 RepID=UPI003B3BD3E1
MPIQKEKRPRMAPSTPTTSSSSTTAPEGWPSSVNSRAERSRHAAKMRRDKETEEISALSKLLPYPEEVTRRLDKGSIIRLTTSYLRMKKFSQRDLSKHLGTSHKMQVELSSGAGNCPKIGISCHPLWPSMTFPQFWLQQHPGSEWKQSSVNGRRHSEVSERAAGLGRLMA